MPEPIRSRTGSFSAARAFYPRFRSLSDGMFGTGVRARVRVHPEARLAAMENPGGRAPSQTIPFGVSHSRVTAPRLETFRVENPPLRCGFPTLHRRYAGVDIISEYQ